MYEYKVIKVAIESSEEELNELGKQDWKVILAKEVFVRPDSQFRNGRADILLLKKKRTRNVKKKIDTVPGKPGESQQDSGADKKVDNG